jgi:hypothetical protein
MTLRSRALFDASVYNYPPKVAQGSRLPVRACLCIPRLIL